MSRDFAAERKALLDELGARPEGLAWCERHARLADDVIRSVVSYDASFSVVATGGFGRQELSPFSDVDLTIVPHDESLPNLDAEVRRLYRELHDAFAALGLTLGYAFRLAADAPGLDAKTRTGLLDVRLIAGDPRGLRELALSLDESFPAGDFVLAKVGERARARARTNDTPLVAEPDLKEGAGGLRDFHAANWLRFALGERPVAPSASYDVVLRARNLLHLSAFRAQDRLTLNRLAELAGREGREVADYATQLANARIELAKGYDRTLAHLRDARFEIAPGVRALRGEIRLEPSARVGLAAVGVSIGVRLGLDVGELPAPRLTPEAGPEVTGAFAAGVTTIRALDDAGLLEILLPELTALRTRLPEDAVHAYTVFEHTIRAVEEIGALSEEGFLGGLLGSLPDRDRLVLAVLLHDVGKVQGDDGHAERGARMAEAVAGRWRLADRFAADVVWLVRNHLAMARFLRVRDLDRADTIEEFSQIVETPERLAMLTLLTYADVKAVAPGVWTTASDTFLRQLYERTLVRLESATGPANDLDVVRRRLVRRLNAGPSDPSALDRFVQAMPADYLAGTSPELVALHLDYARRASAGEPTVEAHPRSDLEATELTVVCGDSPGVLSRLLAALYANDLGIVTLRARTADVSPPVVLDSFVVTFGGGPVPPSTLRRASDDLRAVAKGERDADDLLRARGLDPLRTQELFRWNYVEGTPGILEIRARKGRGMPYRMARRLAGLGWNVVSARVGQWAGSAAAAFYVIGPAGRPIARAEVADAFDVPPSS